MLFSSPFSSRQLSSSPTPYLTSLTLHSLPLPQSPLSVRHLVGGPCLPDNGGAGGLSTKLGRCLVLVDNTEIVGLREECEGRLRLRSIIQSCCLETLSSGHGDMTASSVSSRPPRQLSFEAAGWDKASLANEDRSHYCEGHLAPLLSTLVCSPHKPSSALANPRRHVVSPAPANCPTGSLQTPAHCRHYLTPYPPAPRPSVGASPPSVRARPCSVLFIFGRCGARYVIRFCTAARCPLTRD